MGISYFTNINLNNIILIDYQLGTYSKIIRMKVIFMNKLVYVYCVLYCYVSIVNKLV